MRHVNLLVLFLKIIMQVDFSFAVEAEKVDDELDWIFLLAAMIFATILPFASKILIILKTLKRNFLFNYESVV